jgi:hypothetical protein
VALLTGDLSEAFVAVGLAFVATTLLRTYTYLLAKEGNYGNQLRVSVCSTLDYLYPLSTLYFA